MYIFAHVRVLLHAEFKMNTQTSAKCELNLALELELFAIGWFNLHSLNANERAEYNSTH